jgi:hypothetical protein
MTDGYIGPVFLVIFALVGAWAIVDPAVIICWLKQAHPTINQDDPEVRSVIKFIGVFFIVLSLLGFVAYRQHR